MGTRVKLFKGRLHYGAEVVVHTASSGAVPHLEELYLVLERDGQMAGLGGVRINISYLTGIPSHTIENQTLEWARSIDWTMALEDLIDKVHNTPELCAPARALFDQTLHDARARALGIPLCALWGVNKIIGIETNQTLFWCSDETLLRNGKNYVDRGFTNLKLRMGVESFKQDLHRLALLREHFGDTIRLSADVNAQWPDDQAARRLLELDQFRLDYLEQPVAASSWETLSLLANQAPMTIMLDESVASPGDVDRIIAIGGKLAAHLKLVKCGGIQPLLRAGHRLADAGIPVMVGQMNEGGVATAAAAHCAMVLGSRGNELYGADGLIDDPAEGPTYQSGQIHIPNGPGLGLTFNLSQLQLLWEISFETNATTKSTIQQQAM